MIGSRLAGLLLLAAVAFQAAAGEKPSNGEKKADAPAYSVVAGTVFREPGFALPDAEVVLTGTGDPDAPKVKRQSFTSNTRGEFAFRLPSKAGKYVVTATARGYVKQQKTVEVQPSERVDVTFTLAPESK